MRALRARDCPVIPLSLNKRIRFFRSLAGSLIRVIIFRRTTRERANPAGTREHPPSPAERGSDYRAVSWHGFNFPAKYTRRVYLANRSVVSIVSFTTPRQRYGEFPGAKINCAHQEERTIAGLTKNRQISMRESPSCARK